LSELEENRELESEQNMQLHNNESYAERRVREVQESTQQKFGRSDLDHLEPIMEDLLSGNYKDLEITYTAKKQGTKVNCKLRGF
jgi:hypothetical protein